MALFRNNRFTQKDRTTDDDYDYLKKNHKELGFKSAAAMLEHIIAEYRRPDLFKRK